MDRTFVRRSVSWIGLWIAVGAVALLLCVPPTVSIGYYADGRSDGQIEKARCSSVVAAGWPRTLTGGDDQLAAQGVQDWGEADFDVAVQACSSRRDLHLAGVALLMVPTTVAVLGLARRERRPASPPSLDSGS